MEGIPHETVVAAGSKRPHSDSDLPEAGPDARALADSDALGGSKRHDPGPTDFEVGGVDVELDLDAFVSQLEQAAEAAAAASHQASTSEAPHADFADESATTGEGMSIEEQLKGALASLGGLEDESGTDSADATVPPSLEPTPQPEGTPAAHTPADHGIPELQGLAELRADHDEHPLADDNLDFPPLPPLPASLAAAVEPHPHTPTPTPPPMPLPELAETVSMKEGEKPEPKPAKPAEAESTEPKPAEPTSTGPKAVESSAEPKQAEPKPATSESVAEPKASEPKAPGLSEPPQAKAPEAKSPEAKEPEPKEPEPKESQPKESEPKVAEPKVAGPKDVAMPDAPEAPKSPNAPKEPEKPVDAEKAKPAEPAKSAEPAPAESTDTAPAKPVHDPSRQLPGPPSWERLERERKENERAAREKEEERKRREEENKQHELQALEEDYQAELKAQLEKEQLEPPPDDTNRVLLELRQRSLPVLDSLAIQVLEFLSCSHYQDTLSAVVLPQSERGRAYRLVIDAFEASKRLYQGKEALQSPFLNFGVAGLSPQVRENRIVIQRANLATFCAAVFGTIQIGFSDLNNAFLSTFLPENGRLRKHVGALFLELKTQAYISALTQLTEDGDCTKALDQLFPLDLAQKLQNELSGRPHLSPSEQDFVTRCMKRREIISAEKSHTELARRYHWVPFLREVSDYIQKNHFSLLPKVFLGGEASAEQAKARSRSVASQTVNGNPPGRVMSPMSPADTPGTPSTPAATGSEPPRTTTPAASVAAMGPNSPFPPLPPQTQIKTTPAPPPAAPPAPAGSYASGTRPGFTASHHPPAMRKPIPVSTGIQTGDTLAAYEAAKASAEGTDATRPKSSSSFTTRRTWTKEEEVALLKGMDRVQGPYWAQILELYGPGGSINEVLKDRTQVQLKDKARNLKMFFVRLGLPIPAVFQYVTGDYETRKSSGKKAANRRAFTPQPVPQVQPVPVQGPVYAQPIAVPATGQPAQAQGPSQVPGQVPGQLPGQSVTGQPVPGQPVPGQPVSGQPVPGQPVSGQPVPAQPIPAQPVSGQPVSGQPVPAQTVPAQPVPGQSQALPGNSGPAASPVGQPAKSQPAQPSPPNSVNGPTKSDSVNTDSTETSSKEVTESVTVTEETPEKTVTAQATVTSTS